MFAEWYIMPLNSNAMEYPQGDEESVAYKLWGIILDSQHAYTQRYVSDDNN